MITDVRAECGGLCAMTTGPDDEGARPLPRWLLPTAVILAFLLAAGWLGGLGGRLSEVQTNDAAAYLPSSAEATAALTESRRVTGLEATSAVMVYTKSSGVTAEDRRAIILAMLRIREGANHLLAGPPIGPIVAEDDQAAEVIVRFLGSDPDQLRPVVDWLRGGVADVPGLTLHVSGPAAILTDLLEVYGAIDLVLLAVTAAVILLILVVVYRSPILPLVVLAVAGTALTLTNGAAYLLGRAELVTISGQTQGILDVLVLGAGTDYALLIVSRFREELRRREDRYEAMRVAWRASVWPVAASAGTVMVALACLSFSDLPSTRGLGPVAAIGIALALASMLLLLPAILVLTGRTAFWPFRPRYGSEVGHGRGWGRAAGLVGRRPRLVWGVTAAALALLAVGVIRLEADGIPRTESFLVTVDSLVGQEILRDHFPAEAGAPAIIVTNADTVDDVVAAVVAMPGVARVRPYVDPLELFDRRQAGLPDPDPKRVDGRSQVDVTLAVPAESPRAAEVVREVRRVVRDIPGANAKVGGQTASNIDAQATSQRDRAVVIPLVLLAVFAILVLLLRALLAPVLLISTVVLSYLATLGVSGVVFTDVLGFAGADSSFPLFAFVFLVALGVDYNIFLMTRVREETAHVGHRAGTMAGLALTGGVITSAGVVLAATFAALAVVPLVFLTQLAFAVAFGVLLDTFVVRSLLVPALTIDIGRRVWWPARPPAP
jgi:putative drug exporter of the RND superfamily